MSTGQDNRDDSVRQSEGSIANVTRVNVELGSATIAIVISLMLVIASCGVVMGFNLSRQAEISQELIDVKHADEDKERQAELLKYYLLELDAKFISAGLKKPEESIAKRLKEKSK